MLFQTLDEKENCVAVYVDGCLTKELPKNLSKTWAYSAFLRDYEIEYAYLYAGGKSLDELVPSEIESAWIENNNKLKAFFRSFKIAKVSLEENCFFDLVPSRFLLEYCELKNKITEHVFDTSPRPKNYEFLQGLLKVNTDIRHRKLNINLNSISTKIHKPNIRSLVKTVRSSNPYIDYNIFGTKTGRLTTKKKSFPILTMNKECRTIIEPNNDLFLELDYNAAELRTLLALSGREQPVEDLHEWNAKNIYGGSQSREEAKKRIFAWLYNPDFKDCSLNKVYDRDIVLEKYYDGKHVTNPFGRKIESDHFHSVNLITQSTFADLFLRQKIKVDEYLKKIKSELAFSIHDCLVLDMTKDESKHASEIIDLFSKTELGNFKVNVKIGKNYGEMKSV